MVEVAKYLQLKLACPLLPAVHMPSGWPSATAALAAPCVGAAPPSFMYLRAYTRAKPAMHSTAKQEPRARMIDGLRMKDRSKGQIHLACLRAIWMSPREHAGGSAALGALRLRLRVP